MLVVLVPVPANEAVGEVLYADADAAARRELLGASNNNNNSSPAKIGSSLDGGPKEGAASFSLAVLLTLRSARFSPPRFKRGNRECQFCLKPKPTTQCTATRGQVGASVVVCGVVCWQLSEWCLKLLLLMLLSFVVPVMMMPIPTPGEVVQIGRAHV